MFLKYHDIMPFRKPITVVRSYFFLFFDEGTTSHVASNVERWNACGESGVTRAAGVLEGPWYIVV